MLEILKMIPIIFLYTLLMVGGLMFGLYMLRKQYRDTKEIFKPVAAFLKDWSKNLFNNKD